VLRVEVQSSEAKSELLNSDDNVSIALLRLGEELGKESENRSVKGKLPVLDASLIKNVTFQEENRKDLVALRERADALSDLSGSDSKYWVPKIGLFGRYEQYNNRNDSLTDTNAYRDSYSYGVQLSWNIFDGLSSFAKSKQTTEKQFQSEKNLRLGQIKSKVDTEFWRRKFLYYCSVYQARVGDVTKAEESVRLAKEGRKAGVRTSTDLLDAELELFRSRAGVVNAQLGSIEALINFELVTGKKIYSFE
jgi:outer membrane protein TolC